MGTELEVINTD